MVRPPACYERDCRHLIGVRWVGRTEATERNVCVAFPDGIPTEIQRGEDLHLKPRAGQAVMVAYEPGLQDRIRAGDWPPLPPEDV